MINELIDKIGKNVIEDEFLDNNEIVNAFAIKIKKNGEIEHFVFENLNDNYENLEEKEFYNDRYKYSVNLGLKNKQVVTSGLGAKAITSCHKYGVIFNYNTLVSKLNTINEEKEKYQNINGYKEDLNIKELICISIEDYFVKLGDTNCTIYNYKDKICDYIVKNESIAIDKKIIIFEDEEIENYKTMYEKYISYAIVNKGKGIGDFKDCSLFNNLNSSKPLLKSVGTINTFNTLNKEEDIVLLYKLYKYISSHKKEVKNLGLGIKIDVDKNDIYITDYDQDIYYNTSDDLKVDIVLNYRSKDGEVSKTLKSKNAILNELNQNLDFCLTKDSNIPEKSMLNHRYKNIITRTIFLEDGKVFCKIDEKMLKRKVSKLCDDIIEFNRLDKNNNNSIIKISNIIELKFKLEEYFKIDMEGVKKMDEIKSKFKNDIINIKDGIEIKSRKELMFITGQLAAYICHKSKSKTICNRMITNYHKIRNLEKLFKVMDADKEKYNFSNSFRENILFSEVIDKLGTGQMTLDERRWYLTGLYSDNLLFIKKGSN